MILHLFCSSVKWCPRLSAFPGRFRKGFPGGEKLVACFLKLVARISKSEPLIFSLLPCGFNGVKISFHFSAPRAAVFPLRFSLRFCLPVSGARCACGVPSVVECAAAEEFAQQRRGRQAVDGYGFDVREELVQAVGFGIFLVSFVYLLEQRHGLRAQRR